MSATAVGRVTNSSKRFAVRVCVDDGVSNDNRRAEQEQKSTGQRHQPAAAPALPDRTWPAYRPADNVAISHQVGEQDRDAS